jgi:hypothetical protein
VRTIKNTKITHDENVELMEGLSIITAMVYSAALRQVLEKIWP